MSKVAIRHFHLFCGLGGGAKGFNMGEARVGQMEADFECIGGVDVDPASIDDFQSLTGVRGTVLDMFDRDQYCAWHGHEPPADWREVTPDDICRAAGYQRPHIVFTSPPCKGLSGLLSEQKSKTGKYQALNRLTVRGTWLTLEAWKDDLPEFFLLENVPRIATRGRHLLDHICALLRQYGYAVAETTHDCGELGGLAQSRKRFLLVARHQEKVPPFLYEPRKRPLLAVGDVLGKLPLPGDLSAGPMHRMPSLQWKTWVRLAFVEAGSDWRSLEKLRVENGILADYGIIPEREYRSDYLGVCLWDQHTGTVTGRGSPTNGRFAVADPRFNGHEYSQYGVLPWNESCGAVSGQSAPGGGKFSVADPRPGLQAGAHHNIYRIVAWDRSAQTVTGASHVAGGALSVADPRCNWSPNAHRNKLAIAKWDESAGTVTGSRGPYSGALAIADPRPGIRNGCHGNYLTAGHYGVAPWNAPSYAVTGSACHDNGPWSVADPREAVGDDVPGLPALEDRLVAVIRALDGTWHRPFTTLELAALQSLVDPEEFLELYGTSDSAWRERIGNAVPPHAAAAIASVMGRTLLLAWSGETFVLDSMPIWVQPVAVAASIAIPDRAFRV